AARFSAFANIMWDITNEYHLFRNEDWVNRMGTFLKLCDPYNHIASVHGNAKFPFRKSPWADFAMFQCWDEHGSYSFMLKNRRDQAATGRPMPQINEEYGYEDHYPYPWGEKRLWPARIGDNRRRLAWEMTMAGCYQTTGERANDGTGAGTDTGGGWVNGRGNEHMTMLIGYRHMKDFFTSIPWWRLEPRDDLAGENTLLLAEAGKRYVAYTPKGGPVSFKLAAGTYQAKWFNPRTGSYQSLPKIQQTADCNWTSPQPTDAGDWALLLEK
ncbi:MAG TPA: putative collagen-binding domain-containing protein, partial [Clostridia bacterium]|nr:putative collagen-binding domain-containing protein [Clostridia bacterium]